MAPTRYRYPNSELPRFFMIQAPRDWSGVKDMRMRARLSDGRSNRTSTRLIEARRRHSAAPKPKTSCPKVVKIDAVRRELYSAVDEGLLYPLPDGPVQGLAPLDFQKVFSPEHYDSHGIRASPPGFMDSGKYAAAFRLTIGYWVVGYKGTKHVIGNGVVDPRALASLRYRKAGLRASGYQLPTPSILAVHDSERRRFTFFFPSPWPEDHPE